MKALVCAISMLLLFDYSVSAQTAPVQPLVSISVNGAGDMDAYRGWPLVVEAEVLHRLFNGGPNDAALVLAGPDGSWTGALSVRVTSEQGEQIWPLHLATAPPGPLTLTVQTPGELTWYLTPEETGAIPTGDYEILAVLDTGDGAAVTGEPASVRLRDEPAELTTEQAAQKYLLNAAFEFTRGNREQAAAQTEELLALQPDNIEGLAFQSDLLAEAGQYREALTFIGRSIETFYERNPGKEAPRSLLKKQRNLLARIVGN